MDVVADQPMELQRVVSAAEPAALLVAPRLLCRIIKHHRQITGIGLQVPHRRCYVIDRGPLLQVASLQELGVSPDAELPATLLLIAHPNLGRPNPLPRNESLLRCWRLLFHVRVHAILEQQQAKGILTPVAVRLRVQRIGETEFEEIRRVLQQERHLLPPCDDCTTYIEFVALYLGLRCFAPRLIPDYFPGLGDCARIDALIAEDIDMPALLAGLGPECAPEPEQSTSVEAEEESVLTEGPSSAEDPPPCPSDHSAIKLVVQADEAAARGNTVRAAILCAQANPASPARPPNGEWARAERELQTLAGRLQPALGLSDRETQEWGATLPALLGRALRGFWTVEARLLYDLQKVCIDHERGVYKSTLLAWLFTVLFGWLIGVKRRPLHRPLPAQQRVRIVRHLHSASRRLLRARLADPDRRRLSMLFAVALDRCEERLRGEFRPLLQTALQEVGLVPANVPERVARHKLIEELLDRITERGFLTLGDLRDGLAANQLKLPELSGVAECIRGDPLLRLNRRLAVALDGVYRAGEIYLRWLQRLSSLAFGTATGRFLTRYFILPFVGAFVLLVGLGEAVELLTGYRAKFIHGTTLLAGALVGDLGSGPALGPAITALLLYGNRLHRHLHLATPVSVLVLGSFLFALLHIPRFRCAILWGLRLTGRTLRMALVDGPAWLVRQPAVRAILESPPVVLLLRYALKPLIGAALGMAAALLLGDGWLASGVIGSSVFIGAILFFNSRFGRDVEESVADATAHLWRRLSSDIFPALFHLVMDFFKMLLDRVERLLYAVDEWLRFKEGDTLLARIFKPVLAAIWKVLTYVVRFVLTVLVEPQINPVKHFPVVTVGHKLCLPLIPVLAPVLQSTLHLEKMAGAYTLATAIITCIPGLFGFLVWELKENWRLYKANRARDLRPVPIGHHGETMLRLLRPAFHSGTIPKLFAKLRKAQRRGKRKAARKLQETFEEVKESIRHFVDRELLELLRQSRVWGETKVVTRTIHLAGNRIRVELCCSGQADNTLWLEFAEHFGWLVGSMTRPGWFAELSPARQQTLQTALAGFYKLAGVTLIREQLEAHVVPPLTVSVTEQGLLLRCPDSRAEALYDLRNGKVLQPRVLQGAFTMQLPVLESTRVLFASVPISWEQWVEVWERDQAGQVPDLEGLDRQMLSFNPACTSV
jgi:hypothetical protein